MTEKLMCETCGEAEQECHLAEAGLCGDCFSTAFQQEVAGFFWEKPCGRPLFNKAGRMIAVCVEGYGTEHDHSSIFD